MIHGPILAVRLAGDGAGNFTGNLDLTHEPNGPLAMRVSAWNKPAGDSSYTVQMIADATLFVAGGTNVVIPTPVGAGSMPLKWSDEFTALSATPCKPGTGAWPSCTAPTAADGFTWYENKPGGGDFGDAAFEHTDSAKNPYTIKNGFLRIRATHDNSYVDPYGLGRHWRGGLLATAFPDGSTNVPLGNGYYEARILLPYDATPGNGNTAGGTWPAFWMRSTSGDLEEDVGEWYGNNPRTISRRSTSTATRRGRRSSSLPEMLQ